MVSAASATTPSRQGVRRVGGGATALLLLVAATACQTPGRTELRQLNRALDTLGSGAFTGTLTITSALSATVGSTTLTGRAATLALPLVLDERNARASVGTTPNGPNLLYDGVATAVRMATPAGGPPWLEIQPDLLAGGASTVSYAESKPAELAATALVLLQPRLILRLARGALAGSLKCENPACDRVTGRVSRDTAWRRVHPSKPARLAAEYALTRLGLDGDLSDLAATFAADGKLAALEVSFKHKQDTGAQLTLTVHLTILSQDAKTVARLADTDVAASDDETALAEQVQTLVTARSTPVLKGRP